jgi:TolB-like protein
MAAAGANSVGVMQFNNVTRDSNIAYLSDGLATDIATSLARVPRLEVRSPGAVRAAQRGVEASPSVVGRRLNVRYVVEGDFQRGGDRVRVSVRLVAVPSGTQRWSNSYTRPVTDLLAVQEEIAGAVATAIAGELLPQDRTRLAAAPTRSGEAYDHYLRGNFFLVRRDSVGFRRAMLEYQAAYRADTTFIEPLARQASVYVIAGNVFGLPRDSQEALASAAAEAALRRAPNSAIAWLAVSQTRMLRQPRTMAGVVDASDRALALDSNIVEVLHHAAVTAWYQGNEALAVARYHRALALEPLRPVTLNNLGVIALFDGRYAEALRWTDSLVAIDVDYSPARWRPFRLVALLRLGDTTAARAELDLWRTIPAMAFGAVMRAAAFAPQGDSAGLERIALQQPGLLGTGLVEANNATPLLVLLADILVLRGASAATVMTVLEAAPVRGAQFRSYLRSRSFDPVRSEPRFQRLWAETAP